MMESVTRSSCSRLLACHSRILTALFIFGLFLLPAASAHAHFGLILPSDPIVTQDEPRSVSLTIQFLHPMDRELMDMARPEAFAVKTRNATLNLTKKLVEKRDNEGRRYWVCSYELKRPGDYLFYLEPRPYWEPSEDKYIVHLVKVCVNAFGLEQGWDQPVGLEAEIVPLVRPYGIWTGNLFRGQVLKQGKPVPFAEIEVEYLNPLKDGRPEITPPEPPFTTQVIKADENGIFSYAMPREGWWGFAALLDADSTMPRDGKEKPVELGAVIWIPCRDMK